MNQVAPSESIAAVYADVQAVEEYIGKDRADLAYLYRKCFPNSIETTTELLEDGTTFVLTGDIPAMWLRDSSAQVRPYVRLARRDERVRSLILGLIRRQAAYLRIDPYANAFNREANGNGHQDDRTDMTPWTWERKYELDSLCYPIQLCKDYWDTTCDRSLFDESLHAMLTTAVDLMLVEQQHDAGSPYRFERPNPPVQTDTLPFGGRGTSTNFTGMVWSGFRPSDDACTFHYLIPANMFVVVVLGHVVEFADFYQDTQLAAKALRLRREIECGLQTYGIVNHPHFGKIYAYETDGFGNYVLMDDANVPNLMSIPYLGYRPVEDPIYQRTRAFLLSPDNPYYYSGKWARGIGSPHTPHGYIWPIALLIQGLTSQEPEERRQILEILMNTTGGTGYMHESFDPDDPTKYTRPWFGWANSLFGEFVGRHIGYIQ